MCSLIVKCKLDSLMNENDKIRTNFIAVCDEFLNCAQKCSVNFAYSTGDCHLFYLNISVGSLSNVYF